MTVGPDEFRARRERDVTSLLSQISYLEEEIGLLRRKIAESPRQVRLLEERHAARGARAARDAQGGGRPARSAALRLRRLPGPVRRRHRRRLHRWPQAAG